MDVADVLWVLFIVPMLGCLLTIAGLTIYEIFRLLKGWIKDGK